MLISCSNPLSLNEICRHLDPKLKSNSTVMLATITEEAYPVDEFSYIFRNFVDDSLKNNRVFIIAVLKIQGVILRYLPSYQRDK